MAQVSDPNNGVVQSIRGKITLIQLVDIYRGSASKKSIQYDHLPLYGSGRGLTRGDAERLGQTMVTQRILEEFCEANGLGFVSSYVREGREGASLLDGRKKISMIQSMDAQRGSSEGARGGAVGGARTLGPGRAKRRGGAKGKDIRQTIELVRDMDDDGEHHLTDEDYTDFRTNIGGLRGEEEDEEETGLHGNPSGERSGGGSLRGGKRGRGDDSMDKGDAMDRGDSMNGGGSVNGGDPTGGGSKERKKAVQQRVPIVLDDEEEGGEPYEEDEVVMEEERLSFPLRRSQPPPSMSSGETPSEAMERRQLLCFDELLQLRERICMRTQLSSKFLSNSVIGRLSRSPPGELAALRKIVGDNALVEKHAEAILAVTRKYVDSGF